MLSYDDMKLVCMSYMDDFSRINQNRLMRTLDLCDETNDEKEKKFLLNSTLNIILWDFEEAISMGFHMFLKTKFIERHEAILYHEANKKDCTGCKICEIGVMVA
mgnify:FL=1